jgi:hypothetical protein
LFISKLEAWHKVNKTDITTIKKEIIFYTMFEYELKTFLNTEKNTKLLKTLVKQLVCNNLTLEDVKQELIHNTDKNNYCYLIKIGYIDSNYILYLKTVD